VRLVDDLLDVSRITRGKVELRKQRVELAEVVHTAVETVRPLLADDTQKLTIGLPAEPIHLDADPTRLAQVISNLLNNAVKFTATGGHIWLTVHRQDGEAIVSIRDTGIGIAAEHLPRIFDMFSQVTPALERIHGGLGIGLSLVRGFVELHGGTVEARSAGLGAGSEFAIRLPVADAPRPSSPEPPSLAPVPPAARRFRVLVVDDNRDVARTLTLMLQLRGHEVRTAHDGAEAVQVADEFRADVILLDIGLPEMNGYDVARHIRQQPWGKNVALIALTGWGREEDHRRAMQAGFDHHLTKPVKADVVEQLIALLVPAE
jgi:CheY-like chemotaxis protein